MEQRPAGRSTSERELRNLASAAGANVRGGARQTHIIVSVGDPASEILQCASDEIGAVAAERNVGLIVMGLVGTSGALGARPGSVAYRVLCLAAVPVLALPSSTLAQA